jgi:hypothetical protein
VITEQICLDVVWSFFPRMSTTSDDALGEPLAEAPFGYVYRRLLPRYSLADIEAAARWLEFGGYMGLIGFGMHRMGWKLTDKGTRLAQRGRLDHDERKLVYQEDPYAAFVARQFRDEDTQLFAFLRDSVLRPVGIQAFDGRVDGIEAFRGEILRKLRLARYFVCLLTRRNQLREGGFASSVWLYQETGAAVALGKKPLILVEDGMDEHFAGELQKNYEYILFSRTNYEGAFDEVGRRLSNDLAANHIPPPAEPNPIQDS